MSISQTVVKRSTLRSHNRSVRHWLIALLAIAAAVSLIACGNNAAMQKITPTQFTDQFVNKQAARTLLDVRTPEEFASGHIPGAVNISVDSLAQQLSQVPQDKPVVVYCHSGNRSAQAARILNDAGYKNIYDLGGIIAWQQAGLPVQ